MSRPRGDPFIEQVVTNVAAALDARVLELTPLGETVDLERLEQFLERSELPPTRMTVEFGYAGHRLTVDGTGDVSLSASTNE